MRSLVLVAAGWLLAACGGGEPQSAGPLAADGAGERTTVLLVFDGFEPAALERAVAQGLFPVEPRWRTLGGAGPTRTASLATLLSGAPPQVHGVRSARDVGAHGLSDGARAGSLAARWSGGGGHTAGSIAGPLSAPDLCGFAAGFAVWRGGVAAPSSTEPQGAAALPFLFRGDLEGARPLVLLGFDSLAAPPFGDLVRLLAPTVADRSSAAFERHLPAGDRGLLAELGAQYAEVEALAARRDLPGLAERLGRRRGTLAGERFAALLADLWLEVASATVDELAGELAGPVEWVLVAFDGRDPAADASVARSASLGGGPIDGVQTLSGLADALLAVRDGAEAIDGPWSRRTPEPEPLAGLELLFGPGHLWELELRLLDDRIEELSIEHGELSVRRSDRITVVFDTSDGGSGRLRVEGDRRGTPMRMRLTRDGAAAPPESVRLGAASLAELPLPRLVPGRSRPWPEERVAAAVVSTAGGTLSVTASGLESAACRVGSWPPRAPLASLEDRPLRSAPDAQLALALVRQGAVQDLGEIQFDDEQRVPDALEWILVGGLDPELAARAEFGRLPAEAEPSRVHLRRLGPAYATTPRLDAVSRRVLERLPEDR